MAESTTTRARRRGIPLWCYLTALVTVPLIGVGVLTALIAGARSAEVDSATRAEQGVRAVAVLDALRAATEQEILPALALTVIDDPVAAGQLGVPGWLLDTVRGTAEQSLAEARTVTDEALAAVPEGSLGSAVAVRVEEALAWLRARSDAGAVRLEQIYLGYLDVSNEVMTAERAAAAATVSEGVPARTVRAVQDVQTVAELAQAASRQMPLYLGSLFAADDALIGSRLAWETGWLSYTDAKRQMDEVSSESLRTAWHRLRGSDLMTRLDTLLTPSDAPEVFVTDITRMTDLLFSSGDRDAELAGLVDTAVGTVLTEAAADREEAAADLRATLQVGVGLLLLSVVGAVWMGRTVSRKLGVLAGQATQISQGELVEVEVDGPREVRTVSAALGDAVAGLRRIQDQAQAVARGDLDDALLDQPLPGPLGEVVHASLQQIVSSVRQREELQFALAHRATHDPLTELPNRAQAVTLVTSALHRARRSGEMTGLLFVDLDGFKAVNDAHGHAAGDTVLREVAARMRSVVRGGDVVCRLGGDEFVVLVEPVGTERDLQDLAERLIAGISEPIEAGGATVCVGASIGIAVSRDGGADPDVLFAEADTAAYRAKQHGRGRAEVFDDALRRQLAARAETEAAITAALGNGQMRLHYQPVVDVDGQRLHGYEALIRWERDGVFVPPDEFIPVAESSGLVCDLDRWVLHEATRQLAAWRAGLPSAPGAPEPTMAVNVSGRHLTDPRVVTDVADALAASGLPPHLLVLEVTETVLVDDPVAMTHLAQLRDTGVAIAIDDFGTGYTSIGQLRHMPVDTLKIDRSFVTSPDPGQRELVALIIRAAHTFGLSVVAEGVEEPVQLQRLRERACDHAQGYLLHRPLPAEAAGALLRSAPEVVPVPRPDGAPEAVPAS
ncbi:diguanylate cyclase (GGDEF)-like protein [Geodermatophilus normandii]|uniref:Diguanylate cyclase (GGDEF)-like protein n=1 Tax=Geodermatophilus normandii TaxID=1137989 RepID=A0A317QK05_9ACTN|nr:EAL domain-containing protein [Geodermatophilus normandii]PWW22575.1 diguanylate cyclase (GGDEF)-like protein [Geodermatophilus normandii]